MAKLPGNTGKVRSISLVTFYHFEEDGAVGAAATRCCAAESFGVVVANARSCCSAVAFTIFVTLAFILFLSIAGNLLFAGALLRLVTALPLPFLALTPDGNLLFTFNLPCAIFTRNY